MISPDLSGDVGSGKQQPRSFRFSAGWALLAAAALIAAVSLAPAASEAQGRVKHAHFTKMAGTQLAPVKAYGSKTAPIRMDVFTDYACPTCRVLFLQTLQPLIREYAASGKVYLVQHDYPLELAGHEKSSQAARWANVAAQFGQFEPVEAALYQNQAGWAASGDIAKYVAAVVPDAEFKRMAKVMETCEAPGPRGRPGGVDASPHPCAIDAYIEKDIVLANEIPLQATPTYIITYKGQRLPPGTGYVSWPVMRQFFDNLLKQ